MNAQKLLEVVNFFEQEPLRLDMASYKNSNLPRTAHEPPCGTTACLAGAAVTLEAYRLNVSIMTLISPDILPKSFEGHNGSWNKGWRGWPDAANTIFEISVAQEEKLYYHSQWPEPYSTDYMRFERDFYNYEHPHILAYIKKQMVRVLRDRVQNFIETERKIATLQS